MSEPKKQYCVKRRELWIQEVFVEADTWLEAQQLAYAGQGEIHSDPQFDDYVEESLAKVKLLR